MAYIFECDSCRNRWKKVPSIRIYKISFEPRYPDGEYTNEGEVPESFDVCSACRLDLIKIITT